MDIAAASLSGHDREADGLMTLVYERIAEGDRIAEDRVGFEATVQYIVDEQSVADGNICAAHGRGLALGDSHPCLAGLEVVDITTRPVPGDHSKFILDYTFRAPEPEATAAGEFSMTGSLTEQKTTFDRDDIQASLEYTYPATYKDPVLAGQTRDQIPELDYAAPTILLRWQRLVPFATAWAHRAVKGALNEFAIWDYPAEALLCTRMEIERANQTWREIFEFQGGDWRIEAIFRQEDDNRPVPDPGPLAKKFFDVYPLYDFSTLGLLLPT